MFLFGGGSGGSQSSDPEVLKRILVQKDEEIEDLNAKVAALLEALNKDEMDDFENAINEKNRELAKAFNQVEELSAENSRLTQQLAAGGSLPPEASVPDALKSALEQLAVEQQARLQAEETARQSAHAVAQMQAQLLAHQQQAAASGQPAPASSPQPEEVAADATAEVPPADADAQTQLQSLLAAEQQARMQAEQVAQQAAQAANDLQAQLFAYQEEVAQLQEGDMARARAENQDLRTRLAQTISTAMEAQQAMASHRGEPAEVLQPFNLVIEDGVSNIGTIFATREMRRLGHGWPVHRVREGTWAEINGIAEGDELHGVNGQHVEVMPEMEVIDLLQQRPLQMHWVRRKAAEQAPDAGVKEEQAPATLEPATGAVPSDEQQKAQVEAEKAPTADNQEALEKLQREAAASARALEEAQEQVKCLKEAVTVATEQEDALRKEAAGKTAEHEEELHRLRLEIDALKAEREVLQQRGQGAQQVVGDDETDGWEVDVSDRREASPSSAPAAAVPTPVVPPPAPQGEEESSQTVDQASKNRIAELEAQLERKENEAEEALAENRDLEEILASLRAEVATTDAEIARAAELERRLADQEKAAKATQQLLEESQEKVGALEKQLQAATPSAAGAPSGWDMDLRGPATPAPSPAEPLSPHPQLFLAVPEVTAVAAQQMEVVSTQLPTMLRGLEEELRKAREESAALAGHESDASPMTRRAADSSVQFTSESGWDMDVNIPSGPTAPVASSAEEMQVEKLRVELQQVVRDLQVASGERQQLQKALQMAEDDLDASRAEVARLQPQSQSQAATPVPPPAKAEEGWGDFDLEDTVAGGAPMAPSAAAGEQEDLQKKLAERAAELKEVQEALRLAEEQLKEARAAKPAPEQDIVADAGPADGGWGLDDLLLTESPASPSKKAEEADDKPEDTAKQSSEELADVRSQLAQTSQALKQTELQLASVVAENSVLQAAQESAMRSSVELQDVNQQLAEARSALEAAEEQADEKSQALRKAEEQLNSARTDNSMLQEVQEALSGMTQSRDEVQSQLTQSKDKEVQLQEQLAKSSEELEASRDAVTKAEADANEVRSEAVKLQEALDLAEEKLKALQETDLATTVSSPAGGGEGWDLDLTGAPPAAAPPASGARELGGAEQELAALKEESQKQQALAQQEAEQLVSALQEANNRSRELQLALEQAQKDSTTGTEGSAKELEEAKQELSVATSELAMVKQQLMDKQSEVQEQQALTEKEAQQAANTLEELRKQNAEQQDALRLAQEEVSRLKAAAEAPVSGAKEPDASGDGWDLDDLEGPPPSKDVQAADESAKELAQTKQELSTAVEELASMKQLLADEQNHVQQQQASAQQEAQKAASALEEVKNEAKSLQEALKLAQEEVSLLKAAAEAAAAAPSKEVETSGDGWDLDLEGPPPSKEASQPRIAAPAKTTDLGDDDGWDFDMEGPSATDPKEEPAKPSSKELEEARQDLASARAALNAAEQQQAAAEKEAKQTATSLEEAKMEARKLQEALSQSQEEISRLKSASAAVPAPGSSQKAAEQSSPDDDGWDFDLEGPSPEAQDSSVPVPGQSTQKQLEEDLTTARSALQTAEQQLTSLREEVQQQKDAALKEAKAVEEAKEKASQLEQALQLSQKEVQRLQATPAPSPVEPAGASGGDDGWDFDLEGSAASQDLPAATGPDRTELQKAQQEVTETKSALDAAEQQIGSLRQEVDKQKAVAAQSASSLEEARNEAKELQEALQLAQEEARQLRAVQQPAAPQPQASAGGGDDGWDLDLLGEEPKAPEPEKKSSEVMALQEAVKKLEEEVKCLNAENAELKVAKDASRSEEPKKSTAGASDDGWGFDLETPETSPPQVPKAAPPVAAPTDQSLGDDGWDFDLDADKPQQPVKEDLSKELADVKAALQEAKEREEKSTSAAEGLRQQLDQVREEAKRSEEAAQEAKAKAEGLHEALTLAATELKSSQQEVAKLEAAAAAAALAPAAAPAPAGDDDGWDFDLDTDKTTSAGDKAQEDASKELADMQAALKEAKELAESSAKTNEGLRQQLEERQTSIDQAREEAEKQRRRSEEADEKAEQLHEALLVAAKELKKAQEEVADLQKAATAPVATPAVAGNAPLADDGWDFDGLEAPASSAVKEDDMTSEALKQAQSEVERLEEALQKVEKELANSRAECSQLRSAATASPSNKPVKEAPAAAAAGDDGWDLDLAESAGDPAPAAAVAGTKASGASAQPAGDGWGNDDWDLDFDDKPPPAASSPGGQGKEDVQRALEEKQLALEQAEKEAKERQKALEEAKEEAAASKKQADVSSAELQQVRQEAEKKATDLQKALEEAEKVKKALDAADEEKAQLKEALKKAEEKSVTPPAEAAKPVEDDGWDFDLDSGKADPSPAMDPKVAELEQELDNAREEIKRLTAAKEASSAPTAAPPSKVDDDDLGWDLDDLGPVEAASPAVGDGVQEALREAEEAAAKAKAEGEKAKEERDAAENDAKRLQAALSSAEEKLKSSGSLGQELQAKLSKAEEELEALRQEADKLKTEKEDLLQAGSAAAKAKDEDGWDFEFDQEEVAKGSTTAASAAPEHSGPPQAIPPPSQAPSKQQSGGDDDGWDFDFNGDDEKKPSQSPEEVGQGQQEEFNSLQTKLEIANGRLRHLEDELRAERVVNADGAASQLRAEVASLAETLSRERQEREREEAHLGQLVRRAQEDLRQQAAAARASAGAQADSAQLLEQLETLRQQRDQARSIAQCIARQTSTLAEELYRLRTSGEARSHGSRTEQQPLGSGDPERGPEEEPDGPSRSSRMTGANQTRTGGYTAPPSQRSDGDDLQHPRPSVEVTSGWDVFDPDDQCEHTIPTSLGCGEGWDTNVDDLLDGRGAAVASAAGGPAPELSPDSPGDTGSRSRVQASPAEASPDWDLDLLDLA